MTCPVKILRKNVSQHVTPNPLQEAAQDTIAQHADSFNNPAYDHGRSTDLPPIEQAPTTAPSPPHTSTTIQLGDGSPLGALSLGATKQPTHPSSPASPAIAMPIGAKAGDTTTHSATQSARSQPNFDIDPEFQVTTIIDGSIGSLIALEFDEFGRLIVSREGAGLTRIDFRRTSEDPERTTVISDAVTSCQGILSLNGQLWVTGLGPEGLGLYRLSDQDNDGTFEKTELLLRFKGQPGEHGPHGVTLGPDGYVYVVVGNHSSADQTAAENSPYAHPYEADLVPRVEDPGGHAVGIKAPGGTIVRLRVDGRGLETVAGGIRNAYDLAFDAYGELLIHDSDMESDLGTPWYRPTMIFQVVAGAEFGWRSGWAKFPTYYLDCVPPIDQTGRGSPTGAVVYNHVAFPARYHNALFLGDWSEGRILVTKLEPHGAMYRGQTRTFLQAPALNVTDLTVGPDGALYFCTGGRGTEGSVCRVAWRGRVPDEILHPTDALHRLLEYPQPQSAWARQDIAKMRGQAGAQWDALLQNAVTDQTLQPKNRIRAMDLMSLYGPTMSAELLNQVAHDSDPRVRARAARTWGKRTAAEATPALSTMLKDADPLVRRVACESLIRTGSHVEFSQLTDCLKSLDQGEAFAARRLLEKMPTQQWSAEALSSNDPRIFVEGATALAIAEPSLENCYAILARCSEFFEGFISDSDFVDFLRVIQLALSQGHIDPEKIPAFAARIADEFPSQHPLINAELAKILAYLHVVDVNHRYAEYFEKSSDAPIDKLQVAMMLQTLAADLDPTDRNAILNFIESAEATPGGGSYDAYLAGAASNLAKCLTDADIPSVLKRGAQWPDAVTAILFHLPAKPSADVVQRLIEIDIDSPPRHDASTKKMHAGIMAMLISDGNPSSLDYVLTCLPDLDEAVAIETLMALRETDYRPQSADHYRHVIEVAQRLRGIAATAAISLLEHWTGEQLTDPKADADTAIRRWAQWYEQVFRQAQPISIPPDTSKMHWTVDSLLAEIRNDHNIRNLNRGRQVYQSAQCAALPPIRRRG